MSFPPCMSHLALWVSHKQMAPGVSSLSTEDGTESWLPCGWWSCWDPKESGTTGIYRISAACTDIVRFLFLEDANISALSRFVM